MQVQNYLHFLPIFQDDGYEADGRRRQNCHRYEL
jgi:hypothetical protein